MARIKVLSSRLIYIFPYFFLEAVLEIVTEVSLEVLLFCSSLVDFLGLLDIRRRDRLRRNKARTLDNKWIPFSTVTGVGFLCAVCFHRNNKGRMNPVDDTISTRTRAVVT